MKLMEQTAPICFAEQELDRVLKQMTGADLGGLKLGTFAEFPQIQPKNPTPTPLDDEIYIEVEAFRGVIAGNNPRSVLIAAYRYLTELGVRFVNVGKAGEKIPASCEEAHVVRVHEVPSYRHRGVCIEGAVSVENVIEMVDFLPKVGMNTYFIQFREAHTFFERWYGHRDNPLKEHPTFTIEDARGCVKQVEAEMAKRGVLYQAVGHGWTCEPFGVPGLGWEPWTEELAPEVLENFALVNGVRGLAGGITLNTHACYSNPKVRKTIIDDVCNYVKEHPTLNVLHFWLADGHNCVCECENCKKMRPSDMYITLLNDIDAALTAQGSDIKVVFLLYLDLLWPPVEQKLNNPDRFILMFAPITRSYSESFAVSEHTPPMAPFVYNDIDLPKDPNQNVTYLREWQKIFDGDSFDYDYHYMWAFVADPGSMQIAQVLAEDIKNLKKLNLNGFISCQIGRAMFPNAINMYAMGKLLWNRELSFEQLKEEYFTACYGEDGAAVAAYMSELSDRFAMLELHELKFISEEKKVKVDRTKAKIAAELRSFIQSQKAFQDKALEAHAEYCLKLCDVFEALHNGDDDRGAQAAKELRQYIWSLEDRFQSTLDAWIYENVFTNQWTI